MSQEAENAASKRSLESFLSAGSEASTGLDDASSPTKRPRIGSQNSLPRTKSDSPGKLDSWLSLPPPPPLPEPFATSAPILDRDSIFIAYALPAPINHSTRIVSKQAIDSLISRLPHDHPQLPDVVAGRPSQKRGQDGAHDGMALTSGKGRKKIKPSNNMWAYRALALSRGRSGTSEDDYELVEGSWDDDEKWGGERLLKVLREEGRADVLVVCSRWFGGTLLGPIRFQHIETTAHEAIQQQEVREKCLELWKEIEQMDTLIEEYREELEPERQRSATKKNPQDVRAITDPVKLERLVKARSMTVKVLLDKVAQKAVAGAGPAGQGEVSP